MPIDFERDEKQGVIRWKKIRRWKHQGHEVALARYTNVSNLESSSLHLVCECDLDIEPKRDPHACPHKKAVRERIAAASRKKHGKRWKRMGLKKAVLDVHRRSKGGEYLGSHYAEMIYLQEVAAIIGAPEADVRQACDELFAEEKLDLNGAILIDYVHCFRFPKEMQAVIRYVVEEPLGWPNGDAGDCHLAELEARIQDETGCDSGKKVFGAHYPHIDWAILADFAFDWLACELKRLAVEKPDIVTLRPYHELMVSQHLLREDKELVPGLDVKFFAMFILELLNLSIKRIEIDQAMRPGITPAETLAEMAEYFAKLAERRRKKE